MINFFTELSVGKLKGSASPYEGAGAAKII